MYCMHFASQHLAGLDTCFPKLDRSVIATQVLAYCQAEVEEDDFAADSVLQRADKKGRAE